MSDKERKGNDEKVEAEKSPQAEGQEQMPFKMRDLLQEKNGEQEAPEDEAPTCCDDAETTRADASQEDELHEQ